MFDESYVTIAIGHALECTAVSGVTIFILAGGAFTLSDATTNGAELGRNPTRSVESLNTYNR